TPAPQRLREQTHARPGNERDVLELPLSEFPEEEVHDRVVGDEEIGLSVSVDIGERDGELLAGNVQSRLLGDVREGAVSPVAVEDPRDRRIHARVTVDPLPRLDVSAEVVLFNRIIDIPRHEQIEKTVAVDVGE